MRKVELLLTWDFDPGYAPDNKLFHFINTYFDLMYLRSSPNYHCNAFGEVTPSTHWNSNIMKFKKQCIVVDFFFCRPVYLSIMFNDVAAHLSVHIKFSSISNVYRVLMGLLYNMQAVFFIVMSLLLHHCNFQWKVGYEL